MLDMIRLMWAKFLLNLSPDHHENEYLYFMRDLSWYRNGNPEDYQY